MLKTTNLHGLYTYMYALSVFIRTFCNSIPSMLKNEQFQRRYLSSVFESTHICGVAKLGMLMDGGNGGSKQLEVQVKITFYW